jgi:hypothetical protein
MRIRRDSKSIALLGIFTAMVVALEAVSIPFVTDIPVVGNFTLDWTGIVLFLVLLSLGAAFSLIAVGVMWASIAYRSIPSATFKGLAEFLTILGLLIARAVSRKLGFNRTHQFLLYIFLGILFRSVGMYFGNILLLPFFYGISIEVAVSASLIYIPWNILQAVINVVGGWVIFEVIPEDIAVQAGLGDYYDMEKTEELEMTPEEVGLDIE